MGTVYVLRSTVDENIVKIGYTGKKDGVFDRCDSFNNMKEGTAYHDYAPFIVESEYHAPNGMDDEKNIHYYARDFRIKGTELFHDKVLPILRDYVDSIGMGKAVHRKDDRKNIQFAKELNHLMENFLIGIKYHFSEDYEGEFKDLLMSEGWEKGNLITDNFKAGCRLLKSFGMNPEDEPCFFSGLDKHHSALMELLDTSTEEKHTSVDVCSGGLVSDAFSLMYEGSGDYLVQSLGGFPMEDLYTFMVQNWSTGGVTSLEELAENAEKSTSVYVTVPAKEILSWLKCRKVDEKKLNNFHDNRLYVPYDKLTKYYEGLEDSYKRAKFVLLCNTLGEPLHKVKPKGITLKEFYEFQSLLRNKIRITYMPHHHKPHIISSRFLKEHADDLEIGCLEENHQWNIAVPFIYN